MYDVKIEAQTSCLLYVIKKNLFAETLLSVYVNNTCTDGTRNIKKTILTGPGEVDFFDEM